MAGVSRHFVELPSIANLRVHAESGAPNGESPVSNVTTLYVSPFRGNKIYLPRGGVLVAHTVPAQTGVALGTSTASRGRDLFASSDGAGGVTYSLGTVWDSATARASGEGITWIDGLPFLESDTTKLLIASYYLTSTTQTQDTVRQRLVWNFFNQLPRRCQFVQADTSGSYTYSSTTIRQMAGNAANQIEVMCGLSNYSVIQLRAIHASGSSAATGRLTGIGVDSTSVSSSVTSGYAQQGATSTFLPHDADYLGPVDQGFHYYAQLEWITTSDTTNWLGNNSGNANRKIGTSGIVWQ